MRRFTLRRALLSDRATLESLIALSSRVLSRDDYTTEQIEAALGTAWGVDTELIADGTYFVVEAEGEIVACGGWSRRKTLFGSDSHHGRQSDLLDPSHDAARIRAFFVSPVWTRHGIGRMLLEHCEADARRAGFRRTELMATLPGKRLYAACGSSAGEPVQHLLPAGITIEFVPMRKDLSG